jgi:cytochrome c-type biogenesis protein CcsB
MYITFFQIALGCYLLGSMAYLLLLVWSQTRVAATGNYLTGLGFLSHCAALLTRYLTAGHTPLVNLHESLSFFSWGVVGFFLLFRHRYRIDVLGAFVVPVAVVLVIWAAVLPKEILPLHPSLQSYWLPIHATLAFLGDAIFALAFCAGVVYLIQERRLKSKRGGPFYQTLPSLQVLDEINYRSLTIGFPLLTLGIVTGAAWAEFAWGSYWSWDPKETWSLITWLVYAAVLHQRLMVGWRGKKAAIMSIVGFGVLLFTFLGVNLLVGGLHAYTEFAR